MGASSGRLIHAHTDEALAGLMAGFRMPPDPPDSKGVYGPARALLVDSVRRRIVYMILMRAASDASNFRWEDDRLHMTLDDSPGMWSRTAAMLTTRTPTSMVWDAHVTMGRRLETLVDQYIISEKGAGKNPRPSRAYDVLAYGLAVRLVEEFLAGASKHPPIASTGQAGGGIMALAGAGLVALNNLAASLEAQMVATRRSLLLPVIKHMRVQLQATATAGGRDKEPPSKAVAGPIG